MKKTILIILFFFLYSYSALADIHPASSCSSSDVNTAVSAAHTGDTVTIPSGTCAWTTGLSVGSKQIHLIGSGVDVTIITATGLNPVIAMGNGGSEIAHMTITNTTGLLMSIYGQNFTVHDMKFIKTSSGTGLGVYYGGTVHPKGVIYSNTFENCGVLLSGVVTSTDEQHTMFSTDFTLGGTDNIVYIEGNTFTKGNCAGYYVNAIDSNFGGSFVFRYNTLTSNCVGTNNAMYLANHATQGGRGSQRFEIYNNNISNAGGTMYIAARLRNGTGVVFNNRTTGNFASKTIALDIERITTSSNSIYCDGSSYGWDGNEAESTITGATGTHVGGDSNNVLTVAGTPWTTNALVGMVVTNETDGGLTAVKTGSYCVITSNTVNTATCTLASGQWNSGDTYKISTGYPCRDQIGMGVDSVKWDNSPLAAYAQTKRPAYAWDNIIESSVQANFSASQSKLGANRDYYNYTATFNGTTGVGRGLDAAKPATCTTGVAYFSTDVGTYGTLYKCTSTDTWSSYFTPATCPHPLADPSTQGSCDADAYGITGYKLTGGESDVTAPTILSVYVNGADLTVNFSESITATVGAAFTLDPSGADVTVSCPAVATAATSITCTISRALTAAETATYGYTGIKVVDVASNALATIEATNITLNQTPAEAPTKKLTITKTGAGCTITSSPSGIYCGSTCEFDFTTATQVTLGGYLENGWATITYSGGCAGGSADLTNDVANCTVTCTPVYLLN